MKNKRCIAVENVRIDGAWREVEIWVNTLRLAVNMADRACRSKSGKSSARFGAIVAKARPIA